MATEMKYQVSQFESVDQHLTEFMKEASHSGLVNNSTIKQLYSFENERRAALFLIKDKQKIIGTFGAHTIDIFENKNSFRICARACVLTKFTHHTGLRTINQIKNHSNILAKYSIPTCIEWINDPEADVYISTHPSEVGAMRLMHDVVCPQFEKTGAINRAGVFYYRGHDQTFWKVNVNHMLEQVNASTEP